MKILLLLLLGNICYGQMYVSPTFQLTNDPGLFSEKSNVSIEIGKQWDVFSIGIDYGLTNLSTLDTTSCIELRPNINVFQQGKFTNTFTAGIGYIFNSSENMMTELTSGIEYAANDQVHINISFGQYYYSGRYTSSQSTFFGLSLMYYFKDNKQRSLVERKE